MSGQNSFRTSSSLGTSKPHNGEQKTSNHCMYCGSHDHAFWTCQGGEKAKLQQDNTGIWRDAESNAYCVSFNGPHSCTCKDSCQYLHACSLCLCGDHSTQMCYNLKPYSPYTPNYAGQRGRYIIIHSSCTIHLIDDDHPYIN